MPTEQKAIKNSSHYPPGKSGNPGGRPKTKGIAKYIRSKVGENYEEVIDNLYTIMNGKKFSPANRMKAMEVLLDRGLGKAHQTQHIDVETPTPIQFVQKS